jgi:hypothetical protein
MFPQGQKYRERKEAEKVQESPAEKRKDPEEALSPNKR